MSSPNEGEFLALLGHELRGPLGPIRNAVHILRGRAGLDAQALWALDLIERQLDELVTTIETISEVSRISRGAAKIEHAPFMAASVVEAALADGAAMLAHKGQRCEVALPAGELKVEGDRRRTEHAVRAILRCASRSLTTGATIQLDVAVIGDRWTIGVGPGGAAPLELSAAAKAELEVSVGLVLVRQLAQLLGGTLVAFTAAGDEVRYQLALPLRAPRSAQGHGPGSPNRDPTAVGKRQP